MNNNLFYTRTSYENIYALLLYWWWCGWFSSIFCEKFAFRGVQENGSGDVECSSSHGFPFGRDGFRGNHSIEPRHVWGYDE